MEQVGFVPDNDMRHACAVPENGKDMIAVPLTTPLRWVIVMSPDFLNRTDSFCGRNRDCAGDLQPPPDLHPEIGRLRRQLVEQEQPGLPGSGGLRAHEVYFRNAPFRVQPLYHLSVLVLQKRDAAPCQGRAHGMGYARTAGDRPEGRIPVHPAGTGSASRRGDRCDLL